MNIPLPSLLSRSVAGAVLSLAVIIPAHAQAFRTNQIIGNTEHLAADGGVSTGTLYRTNATGTTLDRLNPEVERRLDSMGSWNPSTGLVVYARVTPPAAGSSNPVTRELRVKNVLTGADTSIVKSGGERGMVTAPKWGPGTWIAYHARAYGSTPGCIRLYNWMTKEDRNLHCIPVIAGAEDQETLLDDFIWSPDGRYIYAQGQYHTGRIEGYYVVRIRRIDTTTGAVKMLYDFGKATEQAFGAATLSPDGKRALFPNQGYPLVQLDYASGKLTTIPVQVAVGEGARVSPYSRDGKTFMVVRGTHTGTYPHLIEHNDLVQVNAATLTQTVIARSQRPTDPADGDGRLFEDVGAWSAGNGLMLIKYHPKRTAPDDRQAVLNLKTGAVTDLPVVKGLTFTDWSQR